MPEATQPSANVKALQDEITRLNKVIQSLMNRAERNASLRGSDFNLFHVAVTLDDQVRHRTAELEAAMRENEKITRALRESESRIRHFAFHDPLTQLANRRLLTDRLGQAMACSNRSGHFGAMMFLDLDNFKSLNDNYGHEAGDMLLIEVAHRLTLCVREVDTVARIGGDEFVVMISQLNHDEMVSTVRAGVIAEKVRTALEVPYLLTCKHEGDAATSVEHFCTSSIGVVLFGNKQASQEDILKWADMAMYQSKAKGRNTVSFYNRVS